MSAGAPSTRSEALSDLGIRIPTSFNTRGYFSDEATD
jgi:hypothetical protein